MFCIFAAAENGNFRNGWKDEMKGAFCMFTAAENDIKIYNVKLT